MTTIPRTAGQPEAPARTMAGPSVKQFLELLRQGRILDPEQLDLVTREILPKMAEPRGLARELVKRGLLTAFQVNQVSQGRVKDLLLGQYLIMERLGEGGMGQVYKARHRAMGRVVALKVMRPERLSNTDAVNRFRREIRAAAQLSHPNVVLAYDADEVNGQHYFAMEFVEGVDLSQLVKARGPLPIKAACEYILQAAQGLKHADDRGLVHRDIKPANLLVTPVPNGKDPVVVKILDMGLARVGDISDDSAYTQLTQDGKVVGTPDYIAPEQARDSRKADIRSDLYSLGCTFYYLLCGKVPFPGGGSVMEKLMKHQMEEPVPIQSLRPEVPDGVRAILKKLITKRPEDRYQRPGELVAALEPFVFGDGLPVGSITEALPAAVPVAPAPLALPITPDMHENTTTRFPSAIPLDQEPAGPSIGQTLGSLALSATHGLFRALSWFTVLMVKPGPERSRRILRGVCASALGILFAWWAIAGLFFSAADKPGNNNANQGNTGVSWLDRLDPDQIRPEQRLPQQPRELVAVLGDPRGQSWTVQAAALQVRYSANGKLIATTSSSGETRLWDATTLREVAVLRGELAFVNTSAFIDSDYFVACDANGVVCIWDIRPGKEGTVKARYQVPRTYPVLSADGRVAAGMVYNADRTQTRGVIAWNVLDGMPKARDITELPGRSHIITVSPTGKQLAIRFDPGNAGFRMEHSLLIWDVAGKKSLATLSGLRMGMAHQFSPDGNTLAVPSQQSVLLIDADSGRQRSINVAGFALATAFGPDSKTLYVAGVGGVQILDLQKNNVSSSFTTGEQVRGMEVSPDGQMLVTTGLRQDIKIFAVPGGRELGSFPNQNRATAPSFSFAPDSKTLALSGADNSLRLFDPRTFKETMARTAMGPISLLALTKDEKTLLLGGPQNEGQRRFRSLRFYGLENMEQTAALEDDAAPQASWLYSPARQEIVGESAALEGGMVSPVIKFWDAASRKETHSIPLGRAVGFTNNPLAVSPDGKLVTTLRYNFNPASLVLVLLDAVTGKEVTTLALPAAARPQVVAFSADGKHVGTLGFDRNLHLFEVETKKHLTPDTAEFRTADLTTFAFSPVDSNLVASATTPRNSQQSRVTLWDFRTGNVKQSFELQSAPLAALAFSADGKLLAASSHDGKLRIWDTASGNVVKDWTLPGPAPQLTFAAEGKALLTGNANGTVFVFRLK